MNVAGLICAGLIGWSLLAYIASPYIGARLAGRHMTAPERDRLAWGGLAVALALFTIAALLIGARP